MTNAMTFDVICEYSGGEWDPEVDRRIRASAGRKSDYSGCGTREGMSRDIGWICKTSPEAIALRRKIMSSYEGWPPINVCVKER